MNSEFVTFIESDIRLVSTLAVLLIWIVIWKGIGLWIAVKEDQKVWFWTILILNTFGILEIVFIFFFSKRGGEYIEKMKKRLSKKTKHKKHTEDVDGDAELSS